MKSLPIVAGVLLVATLVNAGPEDAYLELMKKQIVHCGAKNGYTGKNAKEIYANEIAKNEEDATCLFDCVMKSGSLLKDSKYDIEKMTEFLKIVHEEEPEVLEEKKKLAAKCIDEVKDKEGCKMSFVYAKCFIAGL